MENTSRFTTTANKPKRNSAMLLFQLLFCNYAGTVSYEPNAVTFCSTTTLVLSAMNLLFCNYSVYKFCQLWTTCINLLSCNYSGSVCYEPNAVTYYSTTILVLSAMNLLLCNCSGPVSYGPNAVTHSSATILVLSAMNQMQWPITHSNLLFYQLVEVCQQ